jgi:hypothetical protein
MRVKYRQLTNKFLNKKYKKVSLQKKKILNNLKNKLLKEPFLLEKEHKIFSIFISKKLLSETKNLKSPWKNSLKTTSVLQMKN